MSNQTDMKLMVLDDEPFMQKLLHRMLKNAGYTEVVLCDSGQLALTLIDSPLTCPDIILLDINMPQMDGIEFVRHLVAHHYAGALILVSGEDERVLQSVEKLIRAHKIAVLGRVNKPVKPEQLSILMQRWAAPVRPSSVKAARVFSEADLRAAIEQGELLNYYQPKVAVRTGVVVGVETLVRWRHPVHGMVYPNQFIELAEQSGQIDALTKVVLSNALAQARVWKDAGYTLKVAANLSMDNLVSLGFFDDVVALSAQAGVAPSALVLEVTESRLMQDQRVPLEILTRLHLKRFHLSIDDFGTGTSSLAQLLDIPFDELKIDQSFVHGAWANPTQRAMFDASLDLARKLKMEAVAEGVEDEADWDFLRQSGCDLAQGYFIAKPMPPEDFPIWLADWELRRELIASQ